MSEPDDPFEWMLLVKRERAFGYILGLVLGTAFGILVGLAL